MSIYTKSGDRGVTSLLNGVKVSKTDERICFVGVLDELNAHIGLIKAKLADGESKEFIKKMQLTLMKLMAHGSDPDNKNYFLSEEDTEVLEREIDKLSECLPKQFQFVLPGDNEISAFIHIARAVARRAERCFIAVDERYSLNRNAGIYLNRLSDYLYVLARYTV